ncbi:hypothetical protein Q1695_015481 [Nippostrongylus brasiliensis]|nr:hypothetical protein Q1695_015481 [Nippostrongylus brasiliensis]
MVLSVVIGRRRWGGSSDGSGGLFDSSSVWRRWFLNNLQGNFRRITLRLDYVYDDNYSEVRHSTMTPTIARNHERHDNINVLFGTRQTIMQPGATLAQCEVEETTIRKKRTKLE